MAAGKRFCHWRNRFGWAETDTHRCWNVSRCRANHMLCVVWGVHACTPCHMSLTHSLVTSWRSGGGALTNSCCDRTCVQLQQA